MLSPSGTLGLVKKELYPTPIDKAAALGESLIINHPFIDGNKRTALLGMVALLMEYGIELTLDNNSLYDFIIAMATGQKKHEDIVEWLKISCK